MEIKAVIGANWGDEGKGLMTHHFAMKSANENKSTIVVCTNGGAQRGHTVVTPNGLRHVFHHFGSGTFDGADTYLPKDFILNPMTFIQELEDLNKLGYNPNVYVNPECIWSTPYDMLINQITEDLRDNKKHGSCGMGIWETILRIKSPCNKFNKYSKIKDIKFFEPSVIYNFVLGIKNDYVNMKLKDYNVPDEWEKILSSDGLFFHYMQDLFSMSEYIKIADTTFLNHYDTVIFENAQGLMLDAAYGDDVKNTTPSNTGIKNIERNIIDGNLKYKNAEICYVSRTYTTRHGVGFLPNECGKNKIGGNIFDITNQYNKNQGDLRYGVLNYNDLFNRVNKDFLTKKNSKKWELSVSFTHANERELLLPNSLLESVENVYESDNEFSTNKIKGE